MDINAYLEGSSEVLEDVYKAEAHCDICGLGLTTKEHSNQVESDIKICDHCVRVQASARK
jgi:ribosome-binding protein aMBF1 (putative translation factor)